VLVTALMLGVLVLTAKTYGLPFIDTFGLNFIQVMAIITAILWVLHIHDIYQHRRDAFATPLMYLSEPYKPPLP